MPVKKERKNKKQKKSEKPEKKRPAKKKTGSKKTSKTTKKGLNKKEVKKAVDKLPGLIIEQIKLEEETNKNKQAEPRPTESRELKPAKKPKQADWKNYYDGRDRKWLLWFGVIIFTSMVFVMWGWNLFVKIQDTVDSEEMEILPRAKKDLQIILEEPIDETEEQESITEEAVVVTTTEENLFDIKEKIKQNLSDLISTATSSTISTTTTSTAQTSTTTLESVDNEEVKIEPKTINQSDDNIIPIL